MPTKPTTLPIWATNTGSNVVTGLAIDNINWQTGTVSTVRYTFTGSPDLSSVIVGHQLVASGCTDDTHNGTFEITAVNNASDWIDVTNAAVTDATLDETSSPGTAIAKTGTALIQAPTSSKQTMGWLNDERPPAGYFNWLTNLAYSWFNWLDSWSTGIETDISDLATEIDGINPTVTVITTDTTGAVNHHYFTNGNSLVRVTLPSTFAIGDRVRVIGMGASGYLVKPATGDSIYSYSETVPTDGTAVFPDQQYTAIEFEANAANSSWVVASVAGTFNVRNPGWYVTTFAGTTSGNADGTGTSAQFSAPGGIVADGSGNLYVADTSNHRIRYITPAGVVTTFAGSSSGSTNGTGTGAQFNNPYGLALDGSGNLYVADKTNHLIRKITPGAVVTTFAGSTSGNADGTGTGAQFNNPQDVVFDSAGNLFVADTSNHRIRKITSGGVVTTFAGAASGSADGTGTAASFNSPVGIAADSADNLYVVDAVNHRIRKITPAGVVTTFAGSTAGYTDGTGTGAQFNGPYGIATDASNNVYVTDSTNNRIRKITSGGVVTTIAGAGSSGTTNGVGTSAEFNGLKGIIAYGADTLYACNDAADRIRKIFNEAG